MDTHVAMTLVIVVAESVRQWNLILRVHCKKTEQLGDLSQRKRIYW